MYREEDEQYSEGRIGDFLVSAETERRDGPFYGEGEHIPGLAVYPHDGHEPDGTGQSGIQYVRTRVIAGQGGSVDGD